MNATARRVVKPARALVLAAGFAALAGCVSYDPFDPATDTRSPAAARVEALSQASLDYPRWADFPAAPTEVPTPADIRNRVVELESAEAALVRQVAAINWLLGPQDLEPWATRTRNRVDPRLAQQAPSDALAEAAAWAQRLRERATPPPPITN